MKKIGIIGFGNMGGALGIGLLKEGERYSVSISELKAERIQFAQSEYGFENYKDKKLLVKESDIIVIAVKPQELGSLFGEIREVSQDKCFITICAGRKINYFAENLNTPNVIRYMPNLAAMEGKSVVGISFGEETDKEFQDEGVRIAQALGMPCEIPESLMPAITGLSGSGIAFVFAFIHAMALGGTNTGINYNKSLEITLKTMEGALAVMKNQKINPVDMLSRVISPAGTTIRGVEALEKGKFNYTVMQAVDCAARRAAELEG